MSRDPVHTYTGAFTYVYTDAVIAGRGPYINFVRTYSSNDSRVGPLGQGWSHNYNMRLANPGDGTTDIILVGPQGRSDRYKHESDGSYTPPPNVHTSLVMNSAASYAARHKDQSEWLFDRAGRLVRITDRFGNHSDLEYDASSRLISIGDPAGRGVLTLTYDADGRLSSVRDWAQPVREVKFEYDGSGRLLVKATDRTGQPTTYHYEDGSHRLTEIIDANGHAVVTNTYDDRERVATQKDARGLLTGQQTTFSYLEHADGTRTTTITYPPASHEPGWNVTESDVYDEKGRITKHVSKPSSSPSEWVTVEYGYNERSNLTSVKDGRGNTTLFCYDVDYAGNILSGGQDNLTRSIHAAPAMGANRPVRLFKYDPKNNLVQVISPNGVASGPNTTCESDLSGGLNLLYASDLSYDPGTQTRLVSIMRRYVDPQLGQQTAITKYEYADAANPGAVTRIIPPRGNTGATPNYAFATSYSYYGTGSKAGMLERLSEPLGSVTTYDYDPVGRLISTTSPLGNAADAVAANHRWTYIYDAEDRLQFTKAPTAHVGGTPLVEESRYDAVGNEVARIDANGQVTLYLYDERDSLKEVRQSRQPWTNPLAPPADVIVTEYKYDDLANLIRVTRAKGDSNNERVTEYTADGLNRPRRETEYPNWPNVNGPLVSQYGYDPNGNRTTHIDPLGRTATMSYDALDRLISLSYSDGSTPSVHYTYDANDNRQSMTDGTGTTNYVYDELNRLLSVTSPSASGPKNIGYRYDLDGHRVRLIYSDNTAVNYQFDEAGRLKSLRDWEQRTTSYGYFPDGALKSVVNVNSTGVTYTYDNVGRLLQVSNTLGTDMISRHTYTLDAVGNRTKVDEVLPENGRPRPVEPKRQATTTFTYDALYQLTGEQGPAGAIGYQYDPVGNRLTKSEGRTTTSYQYDRADRMNQAGSQTAVVDANGNLTMLGRNTFRYDQANRMIESRTQGPTQYVYDGDGKRVLSNAGPGPLQTHVYDVNTTLPVLLEDGRRKYVYGAGGAGLGLLYATDGNGQLEVYHVDGLGSVRAVTYWNGNVVQNYLTDAFGVPVRTQGSHNQPFQFTGEERDKETGFYYLRSRYYDPSLGRFTSRDPFMGFTTRPLSLNRCIYAENNPVNRIDPSGATPSKKGSSQDCNLAQIARGTTKNDPVAAVSYYTADIDGDPKDKEVIFKFQLDKAVSPTDVLWDTSSLRIGLVSLAWDGTLGMKPCVSPVLIYADESAVWLSGGAEMWKDDLLLYYK
ncbi:MAG: DUF6531 domain-containing protein [Chloroflexota bacterium]|nr:DUF6531 domain-containing protein [Chloroflexota bacterium]